MINELKTQLMGGTGLINEMDENVPFLDEVTLMGGVDLPKDFMVEGLEFPEQFKLENMEYEYQGKTMTCVANGITTLEDQYLRLKTGEIHKFSQVHLFFNSGGSARGSNIKNNLETARLNGLVSYEKLPLPDKPDKIKEDWFKKMQSLAINIPFDDAYKIPGYCKVRGNWDDMKAAMFLYKRPLLAAVRIAGDYYTNMNWMGSYGMTNHIIVIAGWDKLNRPIIFDTLGYVKNTDGYRTFGAGYEFPMGYIIKTLDEDWKEKRDEARGEFQYCLDHYGKPRNFTAEVENGELIKKSFAKFKNQSVYDAMGRFVHIYNNAYTYGGYSMTDLYNDCYNWRRTNSHIFNFDQLRSEYKKK